MLNLMNRLKVKKRAAALSWTVLFGRCRAVCAAICLLLCLTMTGCGAAGQGVGGSEGSGFLSGSGAAGQGSGSGAEEVAESTVYAMDTVMMLKAYGSEGEEALKSAEKEIMRLDRLLSRGDESSEVYKLNSTGSMEVSDDTAVLVQAALNISESTGGAFDVTVAPVMDLWGFYGQEFRVPSEEELTEALKTVNWKNIHAEGNTVTLQEGAQIDLGGIAKGYLSGRIMEIFAESGVSSGLVSLGGNVQTLGVKPDGTLWNVAIQHPEDETAYIGIVEVRGKAVVTSGSYQRYFEENGVTYHHIVDPSTGRPADSGLVSVTVVCDDGALADGLSTALFVMGAEKGAEYWRTHGGFDAVFVTAKGEILVTEGLENAFQSDSSYELVMKN